MSDAFDSIKQGLQEAIAYARGDTRGVRLHCPHGLALARLRHT
jgi:putative transcriptional regulator